MGKFKRIFNVIIEQYGKFQEYDILPQLINEYKSIKKDKRPTSFDEFKKMVIDYSRWMWWGRCEYEMILSDWPCQKNEEKWDIFRQIEMNIDLITELVMEECTKVTK